MKTVGQLLRQARQEAGLSPEKLSEKTKIDLKYITAIESDHYHSLPSATFTKGFIRNISMVLNLKPDEMVAIFRRDYHPQEKSTPKLINSREPSKTHFSSILIIIVTTSIFVSYLAYQFRAVLLPPNLLVVQPIKQAVLTSPIAIEGTTSPDVTININNELTIKPDSSGTFFSQIDLSPGSQKIKITATNRFNRSQTKEVEITILTP